MDDREKVIKEYEDYVNSYISLFKRHDYEFDMHKAVLALLKKQEPKPVGKEWNECPSCGKVLSSINDMHYCGVCGQAVKWE